MTDKITCDNCGETEYLPYNLMGGSRPVSIDYYPVNGKNKPLCKKCVGCLLSMVIKNI
jgi:hypothetical protein